MRLIELAVLLAFLAGGWTAASAQGRTDNALWFVASAEGGERVGYSSQEEIARVGGTQVVSQQEYYVVAEGGRPTRLTTRTVRTLDGDGAVTLIEQSATTGSSTVRTTARIEGARAAITRQTRADRRTGAVDLPADTRFDGGEGLLADWDPAAIPRLEFHELDLDAMTVDRVVIEAQSGAFDAAGRLEAVMRRYDGETLIGLSRLTLDRREGILSITQPLFGTSLTIRRANRESALQRFPAYPLLGAFVSRSPYRVPPAALAGRIRYSFAFKDGLEFPLLQTGEQRAVAADGTVTVDICAACGPGLSSDPASLADALKPTAWMQSDNARVLALARLAASDERTETEKMEVLTQRARAQLETIDFTGHYSAVETLARKSGDCTEAAVLLAALGRAAGVPTRVVNGLVYSRQAYHGAADIFMPHSWVVAYVDGAWKSFDAALGDFDSSHIALSIGDGDPRSIGAAGQLASLLVWEGMVEVRTRPAS